MIVNNFEYFLSEIVSRSAVPAFFFISALLLYKKEFEWATNVKKKAKRLLLPYFIINSIWIIGYLILQFIPAFSSFFTMEEYIVKNWTIGEWLKAYGITGIPIVTQLWFIRDLFVLNVLAPLIKKIMRFSPQICVVVLLAFWLSPISLPFDKQGICFWGFGCYFVEKNIKLDTLDRFKKLPYACIYIVCILADFFMREMSVSWLIHSTTILYGTIFLYVFISDCKYTHISNFLRVISKYSFGIYLLHQPALNCINKVYAKFVPANNLFQLFGYLVNPVIIISVCVAICILLERRVPKIYSLIKG